ncbi:MAG: YbaN family protein [Defluviitaleaceae bacterium]|nr:YbaN family protein [Defluviitaleaceae bacterium]
MAKIKKLLLNLLGFICLGLGAIGIFMPGLPTTPFVILAAICFSRSNEKAYKWLKSTKFFGPYIEHYKTKQGVAKRLKIVSIIVVLTSLTISMLMLRTTWAFIVLPIVGLCVSIHIALIKTKLI